MTDHLAKEQKGSELRLVDNEVIHRYLEREGGWTFKVFAPKNAQGGTDEFPLYKGHVICPSRWGIVRSPGSNDSRSPAEIARDFQIRIIAPYPEGGWVYDEKTFNGKKPLSRELGIIPDQNLRRLYRPLGEHDA